jgi:hypothetical protein
MWDRPAATPPLTQDNTLKAQTYIDESNGIRTLDPSVRAVADRTFRWQRGNGLLLTCYFIISVVEFIGI